MGLASQLALCLLPASFKPPCHRLLWRSADRLSTASIWCLWRSNGILPHISAVCKNTLAPVFKKAQFCYWVLGQWVLRLFFFFFLLSSISPIPALQARKGEEHIRDGEASPPPDSPHSVFTDMVSGCLLTARHREKRWFDYISPLLELIYIKYAI